MSLIKRAKPKEDTRDAEVVSGHIYTTRAQDQHYPQHINLGSTIDFTIIGVRAPYTSLVTVGGYGPHLTTHGSVRRHFCEPSASYQFGTLTQSVNSVDGIDVYARSSHLTGRLPFDTKSIC